MEGNPEWWAEEAAWWRDTAEEWRCLSLKWRRNVLWWRALIWLCVLIGGLHVLLFATSGETARLIRLPVVVLVGAYGWKVGLPEARRGWDLADEHVTTSLEWAVRCRSMEHETRRERGW